MIYDFIKKLHSRFKFLFLASQNRDRFRPYGTKQPTE